MSAESYLIFAELQISFSFLFDSHQNITIAFNFRQTQKYCEYLVKTDNLQSKY